MTVTEIQSNLGPAVASPKIALYAVNGQQVQEERTSEVRSSGRLLTKQAPSLVPAKQEDNDFLKELFQLMNELLYSLVELNGNQSKLNNSQNKVGSGMVKLAKEAAKKAQEDYKKLLKKIEEAKHKSLFGKIFGAIAAGLMIVIGAITADPALTMMGAFMMTMSLSGAQEALNKKLDHLPLGLKALALTGIAVASAVTISGLAGGITAALTETTEEAAASGVESSAASRATAGFKGSVAATTGQATLVFNPFIPALEGILKDIGVSKKKRKLAAEIAGMILAIIAAIVGGKASDSSLLNKELSAKGEALVKRLPSSEKMSDLLIRTAVGFNALGGWYYIQAGKSKLDQAKYKEALGKTQGALTVYQSLLSWVGTMVQQSLQNFKSIANEFAIMNSRWDDFVQPYAHVAEIQG